MTTEEIHLYAAEQAITEEQGLKKGMEEKPVEFEKSCAEL